MRWKSIEAERQMGMMEGRKKVEEKKRAREKIKSKLEIGNEGKNESWNKRRKRLKKL